MKVRSPRSRPRSPDSRCGQSVRPAESSPAAWTWKRKPGGTFSAWNAEVGCANSPRRGLPNLGQVGAARGVTCHYGSTGDDPPGKKMGGSGARGAGHVLPFLASRRDDGGLDQSECPWRAFPERFRDVVSGSARASTAVGLLQRHLGTGAVPLRWRRLLSSGLNPRFRSTWTDDRGAVMGITARTRCGVLSRSPMLFPPPSAANSGVRWLFR